MKLAVDPCLLRRLPVPDMFASVAQAGYQAVELSPRDGFLATGRKTEPSRRSSAA